MEQFNKFFKDPDWKKVVELIDRYISPLEDIWSIDDTKSAEDVKAQVLANKTSIRSMRAFLEQAGAISNDNNDDKVSFK